MKYANHLNIIVAIIGVIVIVQTLTRTFWSSTPEKEFSVEVSATRPKLQSQKPRSTTAGQRRSLGQPPASLPGTVGAGSSSSAQPTGSGIVAGSRSRLLNAPPAEPSQGSGVVGAPSGGTPAGPNVVTIPSTPTSEQPSDSRLQGDASGRSLRGQNPFVRGRSSFRSQDSRSMSLPPPGAGDAAKRQPDPNAPPPPVRSSMPGQRVR